MQKVKLWNSTKIKYIKVILLFFIFEKIELVLVNLYILKIYYKII